MFKPSSDWHKEFVPDFSGGLRVDTRPDRIEKNELVSALNVLIQKDTVSVDTGYHTFADQIEGIAQCDFEFIKKSGLTELVLITTKSFYVYNAAHDQWQLVYGAAHTATTATSAAGAHTVTVASTVGFADNDYIGIALDNGSQLKTHVNGAPAAGVITFDDAVPVGRSVANPAVVVKGLVLSGDLDHQIDILNMSSMDWVVFTNGVNPPQYFDGISVQIVPGLPYGGDIVAQCIGLYNSALFLGNTIDAGTAYPMRIWRSAIGDPTDWTSPTAGNDNLYDSEDAIRTLMQLGPYFIVYRDRSIARGSYINSGGQLYNWEPAVRGEGVPSHYSVVDVSDYHIIFGHSNLYEYRAGYDLTPIGEQVYFKIFGSHGELNPGESLRIFGFYVEELDEVWFFYPSTSSELPDRLLRYNVGSKFFTERRFADTFIGFGFYTRQVSRIWSSLVGSWLDQNWAWNSRQLLANSPTTHLCHASNGRMYEYNYTDLDDSGEPITFEVITKDFSTPFQEFRLDFLEIVARGKGVTVMYSTDRGLTYHEFEQGPGQEVTDTTGIVRIYKQFIAKEVRFRLFGDQTNFKLERLGFEYRDETFR